MKKITYFLFLFTSIFINSQITISSASEFNALSLNPGDVVIWKNGTYSDQNIQFTNGNGTVSNPITLIAETPGGVIFNGESGVEISSDYVIIDGFTFKGIGKSNYFQFRKGSSYANHSKIRNCAFDDLSLAPGDENFNKHRWIVLYGTNNTVENCSFLNKKTAGAGILVELEFNVPITNPVNHAIINNHFYNITPKDDLTTNSGDSEAIRIGASESQTTNANVLVENNYFVEADGENEIITNKSANNKFMRNTFRRCRGSLVLRHGANAHVEGNFFLGENKAKSGGIRISDSNHIVINNYIQNINNSGSFNNGITLMGGNAASGGTSNGYQYADNLIIAYNTIYNAVDPIYFNNSKGNRKPTGSIAHNVIYSELGDIISGSISQIGDGMTYDGNIFGGSAIGITDSGITIADAQFSASNEIFKPSSTGPVANSVTGTNQFITEVTQDIEGLARLTTSRDAGAFEVSGGTGTAIYKPITDNDVSKTVGVCFLDAAGQLLTICVNDIVPILVVSSIEKLPATSSLSTITITSNQDWTVTNDKDWITTNVNSGSNNATIEVTVTANPTFIERIGTITFTAGSIIKNVIVTQDAAIDPNAPQLLTTTVSAFTEEEVTATKNNPASNINDGDINSTWASQGTESVTLDLGEIKEITSFRLAAKKARDNFFSIEISTNGVDFTEVIAPIAIITALTFEEYTLTPPTTGRFVRLIARGRFGDMDDDNFNSFNELEIYGRSNSTLSNEEFILDKDISIYPNPVENILNITTKNNLFTKVELFGFDGKILLTSNEFSTVDMSKLSRGLYILKLSNNNFSVLHKVLKH
ncbi:chondroitinase-B domain-containing protein [Tenacibaculum agarivorans]|uniref:chondroitinase-B domain-containing protein n=1 Tax=Tenacibaculum agarivorans TaxID=1908389 RepID=UPI00094B92F0|nr:chondroitinase-B domain-containing protein [Tenacibaculum agarivorans]